MTHFLTLALVIDVIATASYSELVDVLGGSDLLLKKSNWYIIAICESSKAHSRISIQDEFIHVSLKFSTLHLGNNVFPILAGVWVIPDKGCANQRSVKKLRPAGRRSPWYFVRQRRIH